MDDQNEREQMGTSEKAQIPAIEDRRDDDTAGHAMGAPPAILWSIAPQVALKLTLPDPPPDERTPNLPGNSGPP